MSDERKMWKVATRVRYVLVDAPTEEQARIDAMPLLDELYADYREKYGNHPIEIHTVRLATDAEIQLWDWHQEMVQREAKVGG